MIFENPEQEAVTTAQFMKPELMVILSEVVMMLVFYGVKSLVLVYEVNQNHQQVKRSKELNAELENRIKLFDKLNLK